jgi:nucleotide-binding universal stress UspA family protein
MSFRILAAHDFSPAGRAAAEEAAREAVLVDGALILLHVAPLQSVTVGGGFEIVPSRPVLPSMDEGNEAIRVAAMRHLGDIASALRAAMPRLRVEERVVLGEPVRAILEEAEGLRVDRIIVGTHARRGLAHLVLGSVAEEVVRQAKVPVVIV